MTVRSPFNPARGANQPLTLVANTSQGVTIDPIAKSYRVVNPLANTVHVRTGFAAAAATTADTPVAPNSTAIFAKADGEGFLSLFSTAGAGLVHVQTGEGGV